MATIDLTINGSRRSIDVDPEMPLLWVLRDILSLTGTKYGCGIAQCGACTVHVDGEPVRSCITAVGNVAGGSVTTIEGLSADSSHPVQKAWVALDVPQCGYCQSGMIMTSAALLKEHPQPTDEQIADTIDGHICRCGTYSRIREGILRAAGSAKGGGQ